MYPVVLDSPVDCIIHVYIYMPVCQVHPEIVLHCLCNELSGKEKFELELSKWSVVNLCPCTLYLCVSQVAMLLVVRKLMNGGRIGCNYK